MKNCELSAKDFDLKLVLPKMYLESKGDPFENFPVILWILL